MSSRVRFALASCLAFATFFAGVSSLSAQLPDSQCPHFRRGDGNTDGSVDLSDSVFALGYLFLGGPASTCADAVDVTDDGTIDLADVVFALNFLFRGGPAIPAPGAFDCGPDPSVDRLGCESYRRCERCCDSNEDCPDSAYCAKEAGDCDGVGTCEPRPEACPRIFDPVCGCDGETYSNSCIAASAGVSVDYPGECRATFCGGIAGIPCPEGEFCELPEGACNGADLGGVCLPIPQGCPDVFDPVCGCDGVTYGNDCERQAAGVQKARDGACGAGERCGGIAGVPCDRGEFCEFEPGTCNVADNQGECVSIPEACPDVFDPVCGCDGVTYSNDCDRQAAGVSKAYDGECRDVCGGLAGIECPAGEFCELPAGECQAADLQGVCVPVPELCPAVFDPVCGCDGQTYGNDCERRAARVQKAYDGPCREVCGGIQGIPCAEGEFCDLPAGECQTADLQGICVPTPEVCPRIFDPVCGCDGRTYGNDCERRAAQVQLDHVGECDVDARCGGIAGVECPAGQFCDLDRGSCDVADAQGVCVRVPVACPDVFDPVCGCDGVTYGNDCERQAARVAKAYDGECRDDVCGGIQGIRCPRGEFCEFPEGDCGAADRLGACVEVPVACPDIFDPVCGCDGVTYSNDCDRQAAGVSKAHDGECRPDAVCGGIQGLRCENGEFCNLPPGQCQVADATGTCVPVPVACLAVFDPVCGCDGQTYGNDCERIRAGVQLAHAGACAERCGGFAGVPCDEGEFCEFAPGTCQIADNQGECVAIPGACPAVFDPVCGCDGQTYGNDCERRAAQVQLAHDGACE